VVGSTQSGFQVASITIDKDRDDFIARLFPGLPGIFSEDIGHSLQKDIELQYGRNGHGGVKKDGLPIHPFDQIDRILAKHFQIFLITTAVSTVRTVPFALSTHVLFLS